MKAKGWTVLCLGLMLLWGCTPSSLSPAQITGTAEVARKETEGARMTLMPPSPWPTSNATPAPVEWTPGPAEITAADDGKTFTISITGRFLLILDKTDYPPGSLELKCTPDGVLGRVTNIPALPEPYYATHLEGVAQGECEIRNGSFEVHIKVTNTP